MIQLIVRSLGGEGLSLAARMAAAMLTALLIGVFGGGRLIVWLRSRNLAERTEKTPIEDPALVARIAAKSGTPTMGGLIILAALAPACLLWGRLDNLYLWMALACFGALAAMGMADDWMKLTGRTHGDRGLKVRHKLLIQFAVGAALGLVYWLRLRSSGPPAWCPGAWGRWLLRLGPLLAIAWVSLVVATMSNAVNVTDGMDGLAGGLTLASLAPLAILAYGPRLADLQGCDLAAQETALFCAALAGAVMGFLWHNVHPAQVFMGDTGSLAIGGSLGLVAVMVRADLLMPLIGLVFLAEFASSVMQVLYFKATGRRILPIAPLHHIWQQRGVPEQRIVARFWLVGLAAALTPLVLL